MIEKCRQGFNVLPTFSFFTPSVFFVNQKEKLFFDLFFKKNKYLREQF